MTRLVRFSNNAVSKLAAGITNSATTLTVTTGEGSRFPTISGGQYFLATLLKSDGTAEIIKVTARSGDTFTFTRAAEEVAGVTTAYAFSTGDRIELRLTSGIVGGELDRLEALARIGTSSKTANYTVVEADSGNLVRVSTTVSAITVTLPTISTLTDDFDTIICKITSDTNAVTINAGGSDTINGGLSYTLSSQYQSAWLIADRSTNTWTVISSAATGGGSTGAVVTDAFTGSGTAGPFTLSGDPLSKNNTAVYVGGVYQQKATYTLSGTSLTLGGAVASGVSIEVVWGQIVSIGTPSDNTVSTAKIVDGAVTSAKLATGAAASNLGSYVSAFNTRTGSITLLGTDVTAALTYTPANVASPTFTGIPAAPTAAADTNTTQLATTAFVVGQAASVAPSADGTAAVGTSLKYARQDHVHPTDTSRAPLASPAFTGTPSAPTAGYGTNTTQLATTQFVQTAVNNVSFVVTSTDVTTALGYTPAQYSTFVNVKSFGAVGNGTTDDTTAIQNALNSLTSGGILFFPTGTYKITSALTFPYQNIGIKGSGRYTTIIKQATTSAKILNVTAAWGTVESISLDYASTPTSGATAIYSTAPYAQFRDLLIVKAYVGIEMTSGAAQTMNNFVIFDYESIGVFVHDVNDVYISDFIINCGIATRGALGGIRLSGFCEAFIAHNGDIIQGVYAITTDATTYAAGSRPAYNVFTNVYFDSAANGCNIDKMVETTFTNCWWSNGRSGSGNPGITLNTTDSISFIGCMFFNNGGHGCFVTSSTKRVTFKGCKFESNSVTAGSGVAHGLAIAGGTTDFIVQNCIAHNGLYSGTQGYGILVNSGASDRYIISGNLVSGNVTGGVSDGGTGTNKSVTANF